MLDQNSPTYGAALRRALRPLAIALLAGIVIVALITLILWISPTPRP